MGILSWFVFGLIAGWVAKLLVPGDQKGGCILTAALGVVGAMVGGFVGTQLGFGRVDGFDLRSFGIAILGSILVLILFQAVAGKRR